MKPGISIIVPCYNSAHLLPKTIAHLAQQKVPPSISWEVIIVNNASTDDTKKVAQDEWNSFRLSTPFKIVDQPKPGLSSAREKGIEGAKYEYILFCDDDNWLDRDYIRIAYEIMTANPTIGVLGGKGEAVADVPIPKWFYDYQASYAVGSQGSSSGDITNAKGYVYGAGLLVRFSAWHCMYKNGFKNYLTDRKGKKLSSGGDVEICFGIRLAGYKIYYDERLTFKHYMSEGRLNWQYFLNLTENQHKSMPVFHAYNYVFNHNGRIFKSPGKFDWIRECFANFKNVYSLSKFILLSHYRGIGPELEGNPKIRRYRQQKGQLIGWLRLRSKYAKICNELYLIKNKTLG